MKNLVTVLFAGAVMATAALAQGNNWANDLNRAKLGRDLTAVAQESAPADKAVEKQHCGMPCCDHHKSAKAMPKDGYCKS